VALGRLERAEEFMRTALGAATPLGLIAVDFDPGARRP
jgi:hypothetical protein